jgi:putative ABC transport system ATP-binding protein
MECAVMAIVSIENATRHYQDGDQVVEALRGLNLTVEKGEFTAIMGPSGSGKTTLLNLIGGMDTPTGGKVVVSGQEVSSMSKTERSDLRRDHVGFIFQSYNLIPVLTAQENTEFVMLLQGKSDAERGARAKEILGAVGLAGMEDRRPAELSGGQQQRVAVARAIATKPTIVLADEPTANLDSETKAELIGLMRRMNEEEGVTFLFSTHDPEVIKVARRVVRLRDGDVESDEQR